MYLFGKNNNHLIKNNYKTTFSLPQKVKLIHKPIIKCACGHDFIICLTNDHKAYCYFQAALYGIDFKQDQKIIDIATEENLILFVTQKGQLYATEFLAQKILSDSLKPKLVKLSFPFSSSKDKVIKEVRTIGENIFLKMKNNLILHFKKNDWMETKTFSDPEIILISKTSEIINIVFFKSAFYLLGKEGTLYQASQDQLTTSFKRIEIKQKLKKIISNKNDLSAINQEGSIVKVSLSKGKGKTQKLWKISTQFSDLVGNQQNYFAITQNQQAWVWGKNAYGQLGLSDYEPRNNIYPLVSLEKFYIKNIFIGQNYACCIVDDSKCRKQVKQTQRESQKSSYRQMKIISTQNYFSSGQSSLNQTNQFLMPIRYTQEQSKNSQSDQNLTCSNVNMFAKKENHSQKEKVFKKVIKNQKKPSQRQSLKSSISGPNVSKVSAKKILQSSQRKSNNRSVISNSKSVVSNSKSAISNSKLTPKSMIRQKSFFKMSKEKIHPKNLAISEAGKSCGKSDRREAIVSYKGSNIQVGILSEKQNKNTHKQCKQNLERELNLRQMRQRENIRAMTEAYELEKQRLNQVISSLQSELKNKKQETEDLYELLTEKNAIISDITKKIQLLESAIQEHQKALTARDNEAESFYLREKQYQLHIEKLQNQLQKMMEVLNTNQRNKQTEIYKKQIQRISAETKQRIQEEKQYYQEKIMSLQRNFDEQRNIYQIEIRRLQQQIFALNNNGTQQMTKIDAKMNNKKFQIQTSGLENNSSQCIESPTFHTIDIKRNIKKHFEDNYNLNQSNITLQDQINQNETLPLKQSNRQYQSLTPLDKRYRQNIPSKKISRSNNIMSQVGKQNDQNQPDQRQKSQVKQILDKIQVTKSFISKSANKLFGILENQKV